MRNIFDEAALKASAQEVQYQKMNPEVLSRKRIIENARRYAEAKQSLHKIRTVLEN